jgi:FkbM family methyltransferase
MTLNASLELYRRTVKRFRPAHQTVHWLLSHTLIPLLEATQRFETLPDDPFWFRLELLTRRHEAETTQHVRQWVQRGMTVVDVGAHVGYYARLCAAGVGSDGRVIALEPHPRNFAALQRNVRAYPQVTPLAIAAAEHEGSAELYDYLMMSASGSLHYDETLREVQRAQQQAGDVAPRLNGNFQMEKFTVRTAPLDDVLHSVGITRVDVVKMDIEGAELGALRGLQRTIQNSPQLRLFMEFNPLGLQAFAVNPTTAIDEVLALGFQRVQAIEADGSLTDYTQDRDGVVRLTAQLMQHMGVTNLLFTRTV